MFEEIMSGIVGKGITCSFIVVTAAIIIDAILGAYTAIKAGEFDVHKLPHYLGSNILPCVGGLGILALGAAYINTEFFGAIFFASVVPAGVKYGYDIRDKIQLLLKVKVDLEPDERGIGSDN